MWIGDSVGDISIIEIETISQERCLKAHDAKVTTLCAIENRFILFYKT